jgi:lipopolysaccharide transport system permease protein
MSYEITIRPNRRWLSFDARALWEFRDLLLLMIRRDFVARYKQTVLGPMWFVLQPLLMTLVFTAIFHKIAAIPTDGLPPMLFYLCGQLGWNYFAQNFTTSSMTFVNNAALFNKVYFPRLIVPLSSAVSNLFALGLQLAMFAGLFIYFKYGTSAGANFGTQPAALLLPLVIVYVAAASLGVGMWISALTAKYRDLTHLSGFLVQVWLYATPVIYPLSEVPEQWRWLSALNPMSMPVEAMRYMLLGVGTVTAEYTLTALSVTALLLLTGLFAFQRVERTFVDVV